MINKLNELVKQEYLWSYKLDNNTLIVRYGLSSVRDTELVIHLENKTLSQALLDSAKALRTDILNCLVNDNDYKDFFGYDTREELEDRIIEETEYLELLSNLAKEN